jgi:protein-disulfide isomerase
MRPFTPLRAVVAAFLAALCILAAPPAPAHDPSAMTEGERAAFNAAIRSYLLENPEVLIEAFRVLEDREARARVDNDRAQIAAAGPLLFDDPASWSGGNPSGDVVLVEFIDYRCGYCRQAHQQVRDLVESDGKIRLVVKEFPILGPDSEASARFAIAVLQLAGAESYAKAHEALIALRGPASPQALDALAQELGLDSPTIRAHMSSEAVEKVIAANIALARRLAIEGTPSYVVGETLVRGFPAREGLEAMIAEARAPQD